jgi:hypothetical protein
MQLMIRQQAREFRSAMQRSYTDRYAEPEKEKGPLPAKQPLWLSWLLDLGSDQGPTD